MKIGICRWRSLAIVERRMKHNMTVEKAHIACAAMPQKRMGAGNK